MNRVVPQGTYEEMPTVLTEWDSGLCTGLNLPVPDDEYDDHLTELVERCKAITTLREGATNRGIATTIFLSEETVKSHVKRILQKFGVANRGQAVATYLESLERRPAPGGGGRRQ